ncbi:MAG: glycosyltransferase family 2 protein [Chloroflexi bacterium]|nr:glycosyltransferase family 2 protein [Chloroflexota bacterium]
MRYALHQGMDAVLLLNNDARLLPGSLAVLCHVLQEHPAIGIVGARLEHPDGRVVVGADCDWHTAAIYEPLPPYRAPLIGVDYVWGTAMLIRSDVLRTIGLFDESYIAYFEDMDLCMRARAAGWHIVGVRDAPVWHAGSATANRSFLQQMWLRGRNWARCFLQHAPPSPRLWFWLFGVRLPHLVWSTLVTILVWTVRRKEFRL